MNLKNTSLMALLLIILPAIGNAQQADIKIDMTLVKFINSNRLELSPSATSSANDFDFLLGKWTVKNRKLKSRLSNNNEWEEFDAVLETSKILIGIGNKEKYTATIKDKPFEAIAIRLFNPKTKLWTDYWADSNDGTLDEHPVVGSFTDNVGSFFTKDTFKDKEILVVYQWDHTDPEHPIWRQAYSADNGRTWEWNWFMTLSKFN